MVTFVRNAVFAMIFLAVGSQLLIAQKKSDAELLDEFGSAGCCDFSAKLDNFTHKVDSATDSNGLIVIYADSTNPKDTRLLFNFRSLIFGQLDFRNFDQNRISIRNIQTDGSLKIQFWLMPFGAELQADIQSANSFDIQTLIKKPTLFHSSNSEDGVCSTDPFKDFAGMLIGSNSTKAHIVIFGGNRKREFLKQQKEIIKTFNEKYKIPRSRLKFFHQKTDYKNVEYWLVPQKARN